MGARELASKKTLAQTALALIHPLLRCSAAQKGLNVNTLNF
jgi:hypothetical protein